MDQKFTVMTVTATFAATVLAYVYWKVRDRNNKKSAWKPKKL